jgi:hypothetical protein
VTGTEPLAWPSLTVTVGPVREGVRALLEEALDAVADDSELRPRLLARLAIEVYYETPATLREGLSREALKAGRRIGGRGLLEALGARHVALWSPDHTEEWIIATVSLSSDVRAAEMEPGGRRYAGWPDVVQWVRGRVGQRVRLVPVAAIVWRIDAAGGPARCP